MKILVEVPDDTEILQIYMKYPNRPMGFNEFEKEELQSMIVRNEPCEHCELESSEKIHAYGPCFQAVPTNFCPNCGRKLRKDEEK